MGVGALFLGLVRPAKSRFCLGRRRNDQQTPDRDSTSQGSDDGTADFVEMDMETDNSPAKGKPWPVWILPHLKSKHAPNPPLECRPKGCNTQNPCSNRVKQSQIKCLITLHCTSAEHPIITPETSLHFMCYSLLFIETGNKTPFRSYCGSTHTTVSTHF